MNQSCCISQQIAAFCLFCLSRHAGSHQQDRQVHKILSLSLHLAESGDTEEPGWFSLPDGSRHGGMCIFFFLFNNKYVMLENTKKGVINMGTNFNDLWNNPDFITEDEKEKINFEVALIGKLIEARESKGLSPNKPLGYRLDIVPCE